MTLEEKPLYKAGEKPSSLGKYGPTAVRDVAFVDKGGNGKPIVTVKQRKNGQYVVVEKIPAPNYLQRQKFATVEQSLAETGVNFRSIKPAWKYSSRGKDGKTNPYVGHYAPGKHYAQSLPPIDLGWKAEPLVGSMLNAEHEPKGGDVKIFNASPKWKAQAKIGSLDNVDYNRSRSSQSDPSSRRVSNSMSPRYGALATMGVSTAHYTPGGAEVQLKKSKLYNNVSSKVGSLDNAGHQPGGGDIMIQNRRNSWKSRARVGSLDNIHHIPEGGDIYIMNQRLTWQSRPKVGSLDNVNHQPRLTVGRVPNFKLSWDKQPKVGSLDNVHHSPRGGNVMITNRRLRWKAEAKVGSLPPKRASMDDLTDEHIY